MQQPPSSVSAPISIKTVALAELEKFAEVCSDTSLPHQVIPISPARLRSQLQNPCAADDDIVMVAALCDGRCVGYHGLLPGYYRYKRSVHKVHWATTFFVSEEMRGKGVGKMLVEAIQKLGVDFAVTRMTPGAERAYRSVGMQPLGFLDYRQLRADKLKPSLPGTLSETDKESILFLWPKKPSANLVDKLVYPAVKRRFYTEILGSIHLHDDKLICEEVPEISQWRQDEAAGAVVPRFHRPLEVVNWMLRYPWIFSKDTAGDDRRYYFSTTRNIFTFKAYEIYDIDHTIIGFTVLSIISHKRRTVVKLLDHSFTARRYEHMALVIALTCARTCAADRIEYGEHLHRYMPAELTERRLVKKQRRLFLFHPGAHGSPLAKGARNITLDYCDGDVAFA